MTNEEKAKAYDEAFERAKDFMNGEVPYALKRGENIMCWIFPELRESEDERIRKELIKLLNDLWEEKQGLMTDRKDYERYTAWLKKKGEKIIPKNVDEAALQYVDTCPVNGEITHDNITEPYWNNHSMINAYKAGWLEKQDSQILANSAKICKDEPKFKVGEWITSSLLETACIIGVNDSDYQLEYIGGDQDFSSIDYVNHEYDKWTTKDAKDGEVLASNSSVFIFKEEYIAEKPIAYCGTMNGRFIKGEDVCWTNERYYPATKEQRDLLFQKMKEAGYEWDAEKKKLKKIEQKSSLSKEDEHILTAIIYTVRNSGYKHCMCVSNETMLDWLKSLKDRVQPQPKQEWSKVDENLLKTVLNSLNTYAENGHLCLKSIVRDEINWLKSLKNRVQSSTKFAGEEQYMKGFRDGIDDVIKNPEDYGLLPTPF